MTSAFSFDSDDDDGSTAPSLPRLQDASSSSLTSSTSSQSAGGAVPTTNRGRRPAAAHTAGVAATASSGGTAAATGARILEFPRNYFHPTTGATIKDPKLLHPWRKSRLNPNLLDEEVIDEDALKREAADIRSSLRDHIKLAYYNDVQKALKAYPTVNLKKINNTKITPSARNDFRDILHLLPPTEENQLMVFNCFHRPFRPRQWMADNVDEWFEINNMRLADAVETDASGKKVRLYHLDRGGFGVIAQNAKSQAIDSLMKSMLKHAGWCIGSVDKKGKAVKYAEKKIANGEDILRYFVVTPRAVSLDKNGCELFGFVPANAVFPFFVLHAHM